MKFYLAPLEGITGYIFRNAVEKYFPGTDRYFTPFIAPDQKWLLRSKETRDVAPENNRVHSLIPQILTNNAEQFIRTADALAELGYDEVNLNLGCPSGTVVSKKRGSGFLAYPDELDRFLEEIFEGTQIRISIKTRVGKEDSSQAMELMEIYAKYPLSELIVHPRTQKDFYRGEPDQELFGRIAAYYQEVKPQTELCYNGNLLTQGDFERFTERFPQISSVMIGRGMLANPGLHRQLKTGAAPTAEELKAFCEEVQEAYSEYLSGEKNVLFRMKELWIYLIHSFSDSEPYAKKIRKAQSLAEYRFIVGELFAKQQFLPEGPAYWNLPGR